jgi:LmbE family N-acetylglucosaminyl deacetylase
VSPHFDDAALSCAALLEREERVDVLTVFAGRPRPPQRGAWDALCGFTDSDEALATREAEERRAFEGSVHRLATLELLEGQYVSSERAPADGAVLGEAVVDWLRSVGGGTVVIPAGAGARWGRRRLYARVRRRLPPRSTGVPQHPDHLFVRDAVLDQLDKAGETASLLYEELPYLLGGRADHEVGRIAIARGRRAARLTLPVDRAAKAARITCYRSQLWSFPRAVLEPAQLPPEERYWLLGATS